MNTSGPKKVVPLIVFGASVPIAFLLPLVLRTNCAASHFATLAMMTFVSALGVLSILAFIEMKQKQGRERYSPDELFRLWLRRVPYLAIAALLGIMGGISSSFLFECLRIAPTARQTSVIPDEPDKSPGDTPHVNGYMDVNWMVDIEGETPSLGLGEVVTLFHSLDSGITLYVQKNPAAVDIQRGRTLWAHALDLGRDCPGSRTLFVAALNLPETRLANLGKLYSDNGRPIANDEPEYSAVRKKLIEYELVCDCEHDE